MRTNRCVDDRGWTYWQSIWTCAGVRARALLGQGVVSDENTLHLAPHAANAMKFATRLRGERWWWWQHRHWRCRVDWKVAITLTILCMWPTQNIQIIHRKYTTNIMHKHMHKINIIYHRQLYEIHIIMSEIELWKIIQLKHLKRTTKLRDQPTAYYDTEKNTSVSNTWMRRTNITGEIYEWNYTCTEWT